MDEKRKIYIKSAAQDFYRDQNLNKDKILLKEDIQIQGLKVFFTETQKSKILKDIQDILDSGQLASGKYVKNFEENWSKINNCKHGVAVGNGGSALEVIFRSLDLRGKEVIVPTNTFIATYNAVKFSGGKPILSDVSYKDMCLDLENIKKHYNENTAAVCTVHIGGIISNEIEDIKKFCDEKNILLIEDAAHAHGSTFNNKHSGEFGLAAAYSFFSTKTFTSGEGGMVLTNDDDLEIKLRRFRDYGKKSQWESFHSVFSGNYRISNITAAIGNNHISHYEEFTKKRSQIAEKYTNNLSKKFERVIPEGKSGWYKYIVYLPKNINKSNFKKKCKDQGLSFPGGVYDLPLHLQPVLENLNLKNKLKVSEDVCERHVCLPIYPNMTDEEVERSIEILNRTV